MGTPRERGLDAVDHDASKQVVFDEQLLHVEGLSRAGAAVGRGAARQLLRLQPGRSPRQTREHGERGGQVVVQLGERHLVGSGQDLSYDDFPLSDDARGLPTQHVGQFGERLHAQVVGNGAAGLTRFASCHGALLPCGSIEHLSVAFNGKG